MSAGKGFWAAFGGTFGVIVAIGVIFLIVVGGCLTVVVGGCGALGRAREEAQKIRARQEADTRRTKQPPTPAEEPLRSGETVVLLEPAPLKVGTKTLAMLQVGEQHVVQAMRDTWVKLVVRKEGTVYTGWVEGRFLRRPSPDEFKRAYFAKLQLQNLSVGETVLRDPGVFGEIKNTGDRTVVEVEITVHCLDHDGKPVHEERFYPVLATARFRPTKPLKPNYTEKFGYSLEDAPSDWSKQVTVKVTDIRFEGEGP